ncbi:hypothetical protein ACHAWF_003709, partial [Thalassiosira exigua]
MITLGVVLRAAKLGLRSINTAPAYNNESKVGDTLASARGIKITTNVPKRAMIPKSAHEDVIRSLPLLRRSRVEAILLHHWHCNFVEAGTLSSVWKKLEIMKKEILCNFIGVCNFNVMALQGSLPVAKSNLQSIRVSYVISRRACVDKEILCALLCMKSNAIRCFLNTTWLSIAMHKMLLSRHTHHWETSRKKVACLRPKWNIQQQVPVCTKFSFERLGKEAISLLQENSKTRLSPQQVKVIDDMSMT